MSSARSHKKKTGKKNAPAKPAVPAQTNVTVTNRTHDSGNAPSKRKNKPRVRGRRNAYMRPMLVDHTSHSPIGCEATYTSGMHMQHAVPVSYAIPIGSPSKSREITRTGVKSELIDVPITVQPGGAISVPLNIPVNPGIHQLMNRGAVMGQIFTHYKIHSMKLKFIPRVSTDTSGEVMLGWSANTYEHEPDTAVGFSEQTAWCANNVYEPNELVLPTGECDGHLFVRSDGVSNAVDLKTYDFGRFFIMTRGYLGVVAGTVGDAEIEYDIEYYDYNADPAQANPNEFHAVEYVSALTSSSGTQAVPAHTGATMPNAVLSTLTTSYDHVNNLGPLANGGTGSRATADAFQFLKAGWYSISHDIPTSTTSSPTEADLVPVNNNLWVSPDASSNSDNGVLSKQNPSLSWELLDPGSTNYGSNGIVRTIHLFAKGEVARWTRDFRQTAISWATSALGSVVIKLLGPLKLPLDMIIKRPVLVVTDLELARNWSHVIKEAKAGGLWNSKDNGPAQYAYAKFLSRVDTDNARVPFGQLTMLESKTGEGEFLT